MGNVKIVTDSAADLPADIAAAEQIRIVPLTVRFGDESFVSGVELTADDFWKKLHSTSDFPTTAAPSAGDFEEAYRELFDQGADEIVSVHLSAKLSATHQSATVAARNVEGSVEVVDTQGVSAATGLMARRAAALAREGRDAAAIASELASLRDRFRVFFVIDTLEHLRRGGRIGGAQAMLGTMLKVKPVLGLVSGVVEPVGRVRTRGKSLDHLAGLVTQHATSIDEFYVVSGDAPDLESFLGLLRDQVSFPPENVWTLGPVVGAHSGPGVIGVVFTLRS